MSGTLIYPLIEQIRDTIKVHGLKWAVAYYFKRLELAVFRFMMKVAYCG